MSEYSAVSKDAEQKMQGFIRFCRPLGEIRRGKYKMRQKLDSYACWFDYSLGWDDPSECSPYLGILHGLKKRADHLKTRARSSQSNGRSWFGKLRGLHRVDELTWDGL